MASYSFLAPRPTNAILSDVDHIREIQWVLAQWNPSLADDAPEDSKRLVPLDSAKTQYRFERLVGSSWNSVGKLMHDVDTLDGYHASISAVQNTIPVYNADAKLVGDLTGNANTATTLKNIRKLQIGGIASGGSVNFDGSADATIEISQLTVNNANDTAINGILTVKHGGTGGADAATARANLGVPAINHASADKSFGVATTSVYGHAIGSDTINATFTADKGYFFSPKGAYDLRAALDIELAKCLPLAGGVMTGDLGFGYIGNMGCSDNSDYRALWINRNSGNAIGIFANDSPTHPGAIFLRASDGSKSTDLWLFPDGIAEIKGNKILTSAGGTLTGAIYKDSGGVLFAGLRDNTLHVLNGGTGSQKGSRIILSGKDCEGWNGELQLEAHDGTNANVLRILPSGIAYLHNERVLTSAGGTLSNKLVVTSQRVMEGANANGMFFVPENLDSSKTASLGLFPVSHSSAERRGAFELTAGNGTTSKKFSGHYTNGLKWGGESVLTSAGGTLTGELKKDNGVFLIGLRDDAYYSIYGCTDYGNGARIILSGKDCEGWNGEVQVQACDGINYNTLRIRTDGIVSSAKGEFPAIVQQGTTSTSWYRKYSDGLIIQGGRVTGDTGGITFDIPFTSEDFAFVPGRSSSEENTGGFSLIAIPNGTTGVTLKYRNSNITGLKGGSWVKFSWIAIGY